MHVLCYYLPPLHFIGWLCGGCQNTHYSEEEEKEDTESQDEEREKGENDKVRGGKCLL